MLSEKIIALLICNYLISKGNGSEGSYDDTELRNLINELEINKSDKSAVYTKTETEDLIVSKIAEIVADAPEDFNTLKEMSDWIASHENDASAMNSAIQTNANNISDLQTDKVGFTNYATSSTTGVVKISYGLSCDKNGNLTTRYATEKEIINESSEHTIISPGNSKYLMSSYGITSKTQITDMGNKLESLENYDDTAIKSDIANLQTKKADKSDVYTKTETDNALNKKVDKVENMGLSSNNFTNEDKNKLDSLENYNDANLKNDIAVNKSAIGIKVKNLLKPVWHEQTINGITLVKNDDGTVTLNGTATADASFYCSGLSDNLTAGNYICSGCPSGGNASNGYSMYFGDGLWDTGKGVKATDTLPIYGRIIIRSGCTVENLTFYPMIRYADIIDDTYEPYQDDLQTQINAILTRLDSAGI